LKSLTFFHLNFFRKLQQWYVSSSYHIQLYRWNSLIISLNMQAFHIITH
jgi:hypothetical protein